MVIVGNKLDLCLEGGTNESKREISTEEAKAFAV